jgi:hypothetical protein
MRSTTWQRVTKAKPCPICGKADYCGFAPDGSACICMRIDVGSVKRTRNGGFLHRFGDGPHHRPTIRTTTIRPSLPSRQDLPILALRYRTAVNPDGLERLAQRLGLTAQSLIRLGIGWAQDHHAWAFPMTDAAGNVVGIRLRLDGGRKFAVRGGREGLFIPSNLLDCEHLLICEGPTDTAALLDLGFCVVGRPSCTGGGRLLVQLVNSLKPTDVVIVADADAPGERGAAALASILALYCPVRMIRPPNGIKDARAWKSAGATATEVLTLMDAAPTRRLALRSRIISRRGVNYVS